MTDARAQRLIVAIVFVVVWGLITHGNYAGSGDDPHYMVIARSLAFDGDLDVANNYAAGDGLDGGGTLKPEQHAIAGRGGVLRPVHDVGMPLLFAPYVRLADPLARWTARVVPEPVLRRARLNAALIFRHLISLAMAFLTGLVGAQLFSIFRRGTDAGRQPFWWALLLTLSPPLLGLSYVFFTEIPTALVVAWLAGQFTAPPDAARRRWGAVGVAIGVLLLIHVRNVALVAAFGVWAVAAVWRGRDARRAWPALACGAAVPLLVRSAIQYRFWGTWLTTPHARTDFSLPVGAAVSESVARLQDLLVAPDFGLLGYAPIFVLALRWPGTRRGLAGVAGAYVLSLVCPYVNAHGVAGGWSPAARMLAPIVPLLAIAVFGAVVRMKAAWRYPVAALVCVQIAIDAALWQWPRMSWNDGDGMNELVEALVRLIGG